MTCESTEIFAKRLTIGGSGDVCAPPDQIYIDIMHFPGIFCPPPPPKSTLDLLLGTVNAFQNLHA